MEASLDSKLSLATQEFNYFDIILEKIRQIPTFEKAYNRQDFHYFELNFSKVNSPYFNFDLFKESMIKGFDTDVTKDFEFIPENSIFIGNLRFMDKLNIAFTRYYKDCLDYIYNTIKERMFNPSWPWFIKAFNALVEVDSKNDKEYHISFSLINYDFYNTLISNFFNENHAYYTSTSPADFISTDLITNRRYKAVKIIVYTPKAYQCFKRTIDDFYWKRSTIIPEDFTKEEDDVFEKVKILIEEFNKWDYALAKL